MYAWLITGLVTPQLLAEWHFDGDLKQFEDHMKRTIGDFKELLQQKFLEGNKTDPDLVAWRQQTWERVQNTADADRKEKVWVYWEFPGPGDCQNFLCIVCLYIYTDTCTYTLYTETVRKKDRRHVNRVCIPNIDHTFFTC